MPSDVEVKRQALLGAYPSPAWEARVKRMSDEQVIAIYLRLRKQGKKI